MAKHNRIYWMNQEIQKIENQIEELTVLSAASMNGTPHSNSVSSPVERFYDRLEKLKSRLDMLETKRDEEKERVEQFINSIDDEEIRVIAKERLIECQTWQRIADNHCMERTTAYKKLKPYI